MKHKHAFINASLLAFAESGESQRSLKIKRFTADGLERL
ncbi:hypothetical protein PSTH2693_04625 [Pseudomonas syringae pv. theae]|nr:hypothetical protein PSTH2693_04625 [Pseudomonas syringae pv. theae]